MLAMFSLIGFLHKLDVQVYYIHAILLLKVRKKRYRNYWQQLLTSRDM